MRETTPSLRKVRRWQGMARDGDLSPHKSDGRSKDFPGTHRARVQSKGSGVFDLVVQQRRRGLRPIFIPLHDRFRGKKFDPTESDSSVRRSHSGLTPWLGAGCRYDPTLAFGCGSNDGKGTRFGVTRWGGFDGTDSVRHTIHGPRGSGTVRHTPGGRFASVAVRDELESDQHRV
jgi:hypothetical protein